MKRKKMLEDLEYERQELAAWEDLQARLQEVTRPVQKLVVCHAAEIGRQSSNRPYYNVLFETTYATELLLDGKHLLQIPDSIGKLERLEKLDLSRNLLKTLPESLSGLKSLKELNLSENELTTLPGWVGKLKYLECLILNQNRLTTLPDSIVQLRKLERLYVYDNELTELPKKIGALKCLKRLYVWNNRLSREELERIRKKLPASTEIKHQTFRDRTY